MAIAGLVGRFRQLFLGQIPAIRSRRVAIGAAHVRRARPGRCFAGRIGQAEVGELLGAEFAAVLPAWLVAPRGCLAGRRVMRLTLPQMRGTRMQCSPTQ
jgi:hypothetical protein